MSTKAFWQKEFTCPICSRKFNTYRVRQGSYEIEKRDADLCIWYKDVNPEFYSIIACPSCNYASASVDFNAVDRRTAQKLQSRFKPGTGSDVFCGIMNYELAIKAHLLAIDTYKLLPNTEAKIAGLYLKIGWFYRQQGQAEEELKYLALAMENYKKAYETARKLPEKLGEIGVAYLVGELNRRLGSNREAVRWFNIAITNKKIKTRPDLEKLARAQWQAAREGYIEETKAVSQKVPFYKLVLTQDEQKAVSTYLAGYLPDDFAVISNFEKMFAAYINKKFVYAFCHLQFALDSVCRAVGLNAGEEVIIPAFAPLNLLAALNNYCPEDNQPLVDNARIKVADTDKDSLTTSPAKISEVLADKTRLIFAVDFASSISDVKSISEAAKGTATVEIVLGAVGSKYGQDKAGSLADIAVFDMSAATNLNIPVGAVVATNNETMAKKIANSMNHYSLGNIAYQGLSDNGSQKLSYAYYYGINPLFAKLGVMGINNAGKYLDKLMAIEKAYRQAFGKLVSSGKANIPVAESSFSCFALQILGQNGKSAQNIIENAQAQHIGIYRLPLPANVLLGSKDACPFAEEMQKTTLLLPMFPAMTQMDMEKIVSIVTASAL